MTDLNCHKMWQLFVLVCCLFGSSGALFVKNRPVVQTKQGPVRGVHATDGGFSMFMGIPYASVDPKNKFAAPLPPPVWKKTRDFIDDSTICPQREEFNNTLTGVPDCLVLNVYVPDSASRKTPLPVMFYIHGGSYNIGWGGRTTLGPQYLMDRDNVVLVTINYRLGIYGFLCLGIDGAPGNVGFKDQVAALRWVRDNIAAFGGDPNSVTIFGNSAGGASVEYHVLSPMSRGLFHRAISQSCTAIAPGVGTYEPISRARLIAAHLGKDTDNVEDLLDFLQTFDLLHLVVATEESATSFRPCVENELENEEPFITDTPLSILKSGDYEPVPYLAGFNDREGLTYTLNHFKFDEPFYFENHIPDDFPYGTEEERMEKIQLVKEFYIGDKAWSEDFLYPFADFYMDSMVLSHIDKSLRLHLNQLKNVFYYELAHHGELGFISKKNNITLPGMTHADELGYLFVQGTERYEVSPEDQLFIDQLTTMWTNFAIYGNPTPQISDLLPVKWEPATVDSIKYLHVGTEMTIKQKPYHERVAFWNMIYINDDGNDEN